MWPFCRYKLSFPRWYQGLFCFGDFAVTPRSSLCGSAVFFSIAFYDFLSCALRHILAFLSLTTYFCFTPSLRNAQAPFNAFPFFRSFPLFSYLWTLSFVISCPIISWSWLWRESPGSCWEPVCILYNKELGTIHLSRIFTEIFIYQLLIFLHLTLFSQLSVLKANENSFKFSFVFELNSTVKYLCDF